MNKHKYWSDRADGRKLIQFYKSINFLSQTRTSNINRSFSNVMISCFINWTLQDFWSTGWKKYQKTEFKRRLHHETNLFGPNTHLLERGHLCEGRLCGLQVAGSSCLDLRWGFGAAVRVAAVFLCHGLDVAAAAHPPARDLVVLPQRREPAPVILRHLWRWGEVR